MSSEDPIVSFRPRDAGPGPEAFEASRTWAVPAPRQISFNRVELSVLLALYGKRVAEGEWRDYALDFGRETAVFSIFRRASEVPLYRVVKDPRLARKQGIYAVITPAGQVLRRGQDLAQVLRVLMNKPELVRG